MYVQVVTTGVADLDHELPRAAGVAATDHRARQGRDAGRAVNPSHHERGSALVEFAIASTVALTLIFGIVDFGRGLYTYHLVSNAARAGSRYAIVRGSACTVAGCPATSRLDPDVRARLGARHRPELAHGHDDAGPGTAAPVRQARTMPGLPGHGER